MISPEAIESAPNSETLNQGSRDVVVDPSPVIDIDPDQSDAPRVART